jgi:hypothetical protein
MTFTSFSWRLVFYCAKCDCNPNEQPSVHMKRTGHQEKDFTIIHAPDLRGKHHTNTKVN